MVSAVRASGAGRSAIATGVRPSSRLFIRIAKSRARVVAEQRFWSAVTGHRFCAGDWSPSNCGRREEERGVHSSRQRRRARVTGAARKFDGDKSPGESGDKSPHSKIALIWERCDAGKRPTPPCEPTLLRPGRPHSGAALHRVGAGRAPGRWLISPHQSPVFAATERPGGARRRGPEWADGCRRRDGIDRTNA